MWNMRWGLTVVTTTVHSLFVFLLLSYDKVSVNGNSIINHLGIESQLLLGGFDVLTTFTQKVAVWSVKHVSGHVDVKSSVDGNALALKILFNGIIILLIIIIIILIIILIIIIIIIVIIYITRTEYRSFHIFLCLKFYFLSPFFPIDSFHVVNSLSSHSSCYFLHSRISRSFFSSSSSSSSSSWT